MNLVRSLNGSVQHSASRKTHVLEVDKIPVSFFEEDSRLNKLK